MGHLERSQVDTRAGNALAERAPIEARHLAETFFAQKTVDVALSNI